VPFIDWSDPEERFGLLVEYVTDERADAEDSGRRRFLSELKVALEAVQERFGLLSPVERIDSLRSLRRAVDEDFERDPVVEHVDACIEELERVHESSA
jgi:hypothetical protein